jgi:DNA-binding NarL/FixJ family response regulator
MRVKRILVADDFRPWRRAVCSMLGTQPELRVIAEAVDGLEAVEKARELKPDLVLLDVGMPRLNGIKASLSISEVSPTSKVLFLSGIDDPEVAQAALRAGGWGYIRKLNAPTELIPAILSSLRGSPATSKEALPPLYDEIASREAEQFGL